MDTKPNLQHQDITDKIINAFFATYNELSGFPEFVLRRAMAIAIRDSGLIVDEEKPLPVWFKGHQIVKFRADLVVASAVIVEVKARPEIDPFNRAQILHYLKAGHPRDLRPVLCPDPRDPRPVIPRRVCADRRDPCPWSSALCIHSCRSAVIGSTFDARRAGM